MKHSIRTSGIAVGLAIVLAGGAWSLQAASAAAGQPKRGAQGHEAHPVIRQSIHQIEGVRDRLQQAPTDFGGHREGAVDALNHALSELNQALQFDKK